MNKRNIRLIGHSWAWNGKLQEEGCSLGERQFDRGSACHKMPTVIHQTVNLVEFLTI